MIRKDIESANVLRVEADTNGFCGGDSGHGGFTYIAIENIAASDIRFDVFEKECEHQRLEIRLGGDCELMTIIDGLTIIVDHLKALSGYYPELHSGCFHEDVSDGE